MSAVAVEGVVGLRRVLAGHTLSDRCLGYLWERLIAQRDRLIARGKLDDFELYTVGDAECGNCGRFLYFTLDKENRPILQDQGQAFHEPERTSQRIPGDAPCLLPVLGPVVVPFHCRSGKVVLGNDFRAHFEKVEGFDDDTIHINSEAGKVVWIRHLAKFGYLSGYIGNSSVDFVPRDSGLDVVHLGEARGPLVAKIEADEAASVHHVSAELWWFAIVDRADLPAGALDSYERPIGTFELAPGDYEMTYHLELRAPGEEEEGLPGCESHAVWAELRRKGEEGR